MAENAPLQQSLEHLFRHESGKMLSVLVKLFGLHQVEIAEDIVQDTLLSALETWKLKGLPEQPRAWLYRAAKNKTIDFLRRERNFQARVAPNAALESAGHNTPAQWLESFFLETEIEDAQLRMMFACCHPALPAEAQLTLILRTLCGLSTAEIAAAFLLSEDTVTKRLYRAKEKIRQENIVLEVPAGISLLPRLDAVLQAVYLLFNEGYKSATENEVIRRALCEEALRLGGLLARHPVSDLPKTRALQALMYFHAARFDARLDKSGNIILLEYQNRSLWNRALITEGYEYLKRSTEGDVICEYHLEAAIASYHASSPTFGQTNWKGIFFCYDLLLKMNPSPFVALNRAIALGFADGAAAGIQALLQINGLGNNYLYHTALGDFYSKNQQPEAAMTSYRQAMVLARLPAEQKVIGEKMEVLNR